MKRHLLAILILLTACSPSPAPTQLAQVVQPTQPLQDCGTSVPLHASTIKECWDATATPAPTASNTPSPTSTATPTASNTPSPTSSSAPTNAVQLVPWHPPGAHLDPVTHLPLGPHDHGDQPPDWVMTSGHLPFTQVRESHSGYKGAYAPMDKGGKGVESYLITHILSTVAARSHGDHDFALWIKTPGTNVVSFWTGQMNFGTPPTVADHDTGERPLIFALNNAGCETWYGARRFNVFDVGWTICGRYQDNNGKVLGGTGIYRGMDWVVYTDAFSEFPGADPGLAQYASDDGFGHQRFTWVITGHDFPGKDVVKPVN